MPMIHTKLSSFLEALKKYEEDFEKEPEELETIREEEPDSDNQNIISVNHQLRFKNKLN